MPKILWLELDQNDPLKISQGFYYVAKSLGIDLAPVSTKPISPEVSLTEHIINQIRSADGFILRRYDLEGAIFWEEIKNELRCSKRLLINHPNLSIDSNINELLEDFDISIPQYHICDPYGGKWERITTAKKKDLAGEVIQGLFDNVEELLIQQPDVIWYTGRAIPLISHPDTFVVDAKTDLHVDIGNRRNVSAVACPYGDGEDIKVIAINGGLFHEMYEGPVGDVFPGITKNRPFAANIIAWLSGTIQLTVMTGAAGRLHIFEVNLADIIESILRNKYGTEYIQKGYPEKVQKKIADRREQGNKESEGALIDIMDMKKIIEENWGGFSTYFGETGTKKVDWLNRLNEIRNRCFHAVRYRTNPVSPDDMEYLNGCIDRILKVATILKQKGLFYRGGN